MENPFSRKLTKRSIFDLFTVGVLRGLTYLLLIAGACIFANIIWKGVPVIAERGPSYIVGAEVPTARHDFTDALGELRRLSEPEKFLYDYLIEDPEPQQIMLTKEDKIADPKVVLRDNPEFSRRLGAATLSGLTVESVLQNASFRAQELIKNLEGNQVNGFDSSAMIADLQKQIALMDGVKETHLEAQFELLQQVAEDYARTVNQLKPYLGKAPQGILDALAEAKKLVPKLEEKANEIITTKEEELYADESLAGDLNEFVEYLKPLAEVQDSRNMQLMEAWVLALAASEKLSVADEYFNVKRAIRQRVSKIRDMEKLLEQPRMREAIQAAIAGEGEAVVGKVSTERSAGSIIGPILGTALLVITCVVIALALGVAAAIYLSEYAGETTGTSSTLTLCLVGAFLALLIWVVVGWVLPKTADFTTVLISRLVVIAAVLPFTKKIITHWVEVVRLAIINLAGVPSIVFGIFGFALFVLAGPKLTSNPVDDAEIYFNLPGDWVIVKGWGTTVLSGAVTLAFMILPVVIVAAEEALRAVPKGFREASLALGASKWETIRKAVLPYATPGILTSSVLAITRVAGETAPIMFTAAVMSRDVLPWQDGMNQPRSAWELDGWNPLTWLDQPVMALPYHVYSLAQKLPETVAAEESQYASVLVFIALVFALALASVLLRIRLRAKLKW